MLLIAHRGDTISCKPNTLEGFLSAFKKGANGIELDVHLFRDEIIVVHDFLFDQNTEYPLLTDVLNKIHSYGRIEVEIKSYSSDILEPLKKILDTYPKADFELTTSEVPLAPFVKESFPHIPFGLILQDSLFENWMTNELVAQKIIGWATMSQTNRVHVSLKVLSQFGGDALVNKIHEAGYIVHSHIFKSNTEHEDLLTLSHWGVDQCTIDDVQLVTKK